MEAFEDSNCHSMSDSFPLYERYLRTFNVVDTFLEENNEVIDNEPSFRHSDIGQADNINNTVLHLPKDILKNSVVAETTFGCVNTDNICSNIRDITPINIQSDLRAKISFPEMLDGGSLLNSSITEESNLTDKSEQIDVPVSSEDSKSEHSKHPKPVIITSLITMENSNNAVDSVPLFLNVRHSESIFKLPVRELTFNGTLKHVQKLKPIVDPISALTSALSNGSENEELVSDTKFPSSDLSNFSNTEFLEHKSDSDVKFSDVETSLEVSRSEVTESTGDSQYEGCPRKDVTLAKVDDNSSKWNLEQSTSSLEASFDSGVRSPDMFSEDDCEGPVLEADQESEPDFWNFLKDFNAFDKCAIRRMEETLQGVPPPPSVTILKMNVSEMLSKYYCFLPIFNQETPVNDPEVITTTPTKRTSYVRMPTELPDNILEDTTEYNEISGKSETKQDSDISETCSSLINQTAAVITEEKMIERSDSTCSISKDSFKTIVDMNKNSDKTVILKMCTETEAKETGWPNVLKCRYYDVHYNITRFSERVEQLAMRCGERYVGAETDSSITVYSGGLQSPSSASKRKALRLKMAQAKSPGRRLSHLARRRQAFCSAATISEKALSSTSKMVLIDKNFFPHRKLINSSERNPRLRRTPGKRTPGRKTPAKKTPAKTPRTRSGGSSRKKAMRRLLMDPDSLTRSQPTRESSKRALFLSPEHKKPIPQVACSSVPLVAMKSKRNLFGSPALAETKSLDGGSRSDMFLKRKRDSLDDVVESRSKIAKSLSFGGDSVLSLRGELSMSRRASEMGASKTMAALDEQHRKKLLWAVSEALRAHGWRMQSPGFREKASSLARLVRRLLALPAHAAARASAVSTSEMFLKIARQHVFSIIQGRSIDECFQEEQARLSASRPRLTGYVSAAAYQRVKENTCDGLKQDLQRSGSKNILQDKLLNVDTNSSSSGLSLLDKPALYKSNSMPSFEEAAKMRARRQISFDNVDFPKR